MATTYVYIIGHRYRKKSPVKIGLADDVETRAAELQTGNPRELEILAKLGPMLRETAFAMESDFHNRCRKWRIRGEWFTWHALRYLSNKPPKRDKNTERNPRHRPTPGFLNRPIAEDYIGEEAAQHMRSIRTEGSQI